MAPEWCLEQTEISIFYQPDTAESLTMQKPRTSIVKKSLASWILVGNYKLKLLLLMTVCVTVIICLCGRRGKASKLIGTNPDLTDPSENGVVPATGALIAPIELATGSKVYFVGKPNPLMMRHAPKRLD